MYAITDGCCISIFSFDIYFFSDVLSFLTQRGLFTAGVDLLSKVLGPTKDPALNLYDLIKINEDLTALFGLPDDVLFALKTFARGSVMFATRFDAPLRAATATATLQRGMNEGDREIGVITKKVRQALSTLKELVSNKEVHIDDFKLSLDGMIAELKSRRRNTVSTELENIAHFFKSDTDLDDTLANLYAAFSLMNYRDVLTPFKSALIELRLLPIAATDAINICPAIAAVTTNFFVCKAPAILADVTQSLAGLSHLGLSFVGKLTTADLILLFLRKHSGGNTHLFIDSVTFSLDDLPVCILLL